MKNVSFGKEKDFPIPKRNDVELSDENELDLDDENELDLDDDNELDLDDENESSENEKNNNKEKENNNQYEEFELSPNDPKNEKVVLNSSENKDDDSDKSSDEIKQKYKNNKIIQKEKDNNKEENNNSKEEEENSEEENEESIEKSEDNEEEEENKNEEEILRNKKKNNINNDKEEDKNEGIENEKKSRQKGIEDILIESIKNKENVTSQKIHMAEEIDFKAIPDKLIATDQYGFLLSNNNQNDDANNKSEDLLQINARLEKWRYMMENYNEFSTKKFSKLKSRTRKGIPDSLRSYVWQIFAEKEKYEEKNIFNKLESIPINEDIERVIIKDLDRTFPACQFFKEKYGNGQRKLYKVLTSYSKYNTSTGYVQGMGFIVALFLTYMDEESSFFMLHSLMKKYGLEGFYQPNFPKLKGTFYVLLNLLKKFVPKVYELFKKEGMLPSMYSSEWFICLFSRNLPFNTLVRIFDVFLLEGYKVIYRFALAFLKLKEDKFLEGKDGLASIMQTLNECYDNVDTEKLFSVAFGFSISRKYIEKLENEYESIKNDQKNEFVKQL